MTSNKVVDANSIKEAFDLGSILNKIIGGYDLYYSVRRVIHMSKNNKKNIPWKIGASGSLLIATIVCNKNYECQMMNGLGQVLTIC